MPLHIYLSGLVGCTAIVIASQQGVWIGHFWEAPSFVGDDPQFQELVLDPITNGDTNRMPSPFPLAEAGGILSSGTNVRIFISTPLDLKTGNQKLLYPDKVEQVKSLLTAQGAPFNGVPIEVRGYVKATQDEVENNVFDYKPRTKVLIQYDNNQVDEPPKPQQQAIWRVWLEVQMYQDEWDATAAQRDPSTAPSGSALSISGSVDSLTSAAASFVSSGSSATASPSSTSNIFANSQVTITSSIPSGTSLSNTTPLVTSSPSCYPFQDPDAGPGPQGCECDGLDGIFPYLNSSTGQSDYNPCGFTTTPTTASSTAAPFTTTESNGDVVSCASSAYYNYAVNSIPTCAGATSVFSTVASIASAYSASTASIASVKSLSAASVSASSAAAASVSAAYSSLAAAPSAGCSILSNDGFGDSTFEIYGINGWADNGKKLFNEEEGCGILSGFTFYTDGQSVFLGQMRNTQYAYFGLSFFKSGCVERAVHSAGGPPPGTKPGEITCKRTEILNDKQLDAVSSIKTTQANAVKLVAEGRANSSLSTSNEEKAAVDTSFLLPAAARNPQSDPSLVASASAALPHLSTAQSGSSPAPTSTPS